jgi:hypothetical protein
MAHGTWQYNAAAVQWHMAHGSKTSVGTAEALMWHQQVDRPQLQLQMQTGAD